MVTQGSFFSSKEGGMFLEKLRLTLSFRGKNESWVAGRARLVTRFDVNNSRLGVSYFHHSRLLWTLSIGGDYISRSSLPFSKSLI